MIGYYNYTVILTYLSLASGVTGIYSAVNGKITLSVLCLMLSGFFDMFDGTIAKTKSRTKDEELFGIQIDSLSDLICFGVLPTILINAIIGKVTIIGICVSVIYVLAALIRLAYYNVLEEKRQNENSHVEKEYVGMPVTVVAVLIPVLCFIRQYILSVFHIVSLITLILIALAFVSRIKFKRPKTCVMIALITIGFVELTLLILQKCGVF